MKLLRDNDEMPFGKHKGTPMRDVPASYLHWLWTNEKDPMSKKVKVEPVAEYIDFHIRLLQVEYPDGIWE